MSGSPKRGDRTPANSSRPETVDGRPEMPNRTIGWISRFPHTGAVVVLEPMSRRLERPHRLRQGPGEDGEASTQTYTSFGRTE